MAFEKFQKTNRKKRFVGVLSVVRKTTAMKKLFLMIAVANGII